MAKPKCDPVELPPPPFGLERLPLVKATVDAGPRIGEVARLEPAELKRRPAVAETHSEGRIDEIHRLRWTGQASACEAGHCQTTRTHAQVQPAVESTSQGSGK